MFEGKTLHPTTMAISHPPSKQAAVKRRMCSEGGKTSVCLLGNPLKNTAVDDDDGEKTDGLKER